MAGVTQQNFVSPRTRAIQGAQSTVFKSFFAPKAILGPGPPYRKFGPFLGVWVQDGAIYAF